MPGAIPGPVMVCPTNILTSVTNNVTAVDPAVITVAESTKPGSTILAETKPAVSACVASIQPAESVPAVPRTESATCLGLLAAETNANILALVVVNVVVVTYLLILPPTVIPPLVMFNVPATGVVGVAVKPAIPNTNTFPFVFIFPLNVKVPETVPVFDPDKSVFGFVKPIPFILELLTVKLAKLALDNDVVIGKRFLKTPEPFMVRLAELWVTVGVPKFAAVTSPMLRVPMVVNIPLLVTLPPRIVLLLLLVLYSPFVTVRSPAIIVFVEAEATNAGAKNDKVCAPLKVAVAACDNVRVVPEIAETVVPTAIPLPDTPCPTKILVLAADNVIAVDPLETPAVVVACVVYGYSDVVFTIIFPKENPVPVENSKPFVPARFVETPSPN